MSNYLNSLAEIKRLCRVVKGPDVIRPEEMLNQSVERIIAMCNLASIPHPSEDFDIYSNGITYLVRDGNTITLYQLRDTEIL